MHNSLQEMLKLQEGHNLYRSGVGMLLYLVKYSRPDIANPVRELSKVLDTPTYTRKFQGNATCYQVRARYREVWSTRSSNQGKGWILETGMYASAILITQKIQTHTGVYVTGYVLSIWREFPCAGNQRPALRCQVLKPSGLLYQKRPRRSFLCYNYWKRWESR